MTSVRMSDAWFERKIRNESDLNQEKSGRLWRNPEQWVILRFSGWPVKIVGKAVILRNLVRMITYLGASGCTTVATVFYYTGWSI